MSDDVLSVDIDHLTVGEIEEIEDRAGSPIDSFGDPTKPKGKLLHALAFVMRRRDNPNFTWEDAGKLRVELSTDNPVRPTNAAG